MHVNFMFIVVEYYYSVIVAIGFNDPYSFSNCFSHFSILPVFKFPKKAVFTVMAHNMFLLYIIIVWQGTFFNTSTLYLFCCCRYLISFRFKFTWLLVKQYDQYKTLNPANERGNIILEMTSIRFASDCTRVDKEVQTVWTAPTFPLPLGS